MTDHDPIDELVADLRTDVPAMSDKAFAAGRARLRAVVEPAPVMTELEPDAAVVPLQRKRLLRSPPRRLIASAAAAVVLAAGVLFVQAARPDSPVPAASAAATAQLRRGQDRPRRRADRAGPVPLLRVTQLGHDGSEWF